MLVKIYGDMNSSTFRCVWAAEELGLQYELVQIPPQTCRESEVLFALNPNRKIPVIDDAGFVLWESMAINHYLAGKAGGPLAPADSGEAAHMQMWSFWVASECLRDCFAILSQIVFLSPSDRSENILRDSTERLRQPLGVLEHHLQDNKFLVADRLTIADLNVASVFGWLSAAQFDLSAQPNVAGWLQVISERPAAMKCAAMAASQSAIAPL